MISQQRESESILFHNLNPLRMRSNASLLQEEDCSRSHHLAMTYPGISNPKFTNPEENVQSQPMKRLRDAIFELASSRQTHPLSEERTKKIEACIRQIFPIIRTPDHPPYSEMIYKAILALDEEGGSTKSSISDYIKLHYDDLPWAHDAFLSHHLKKLGEGGEIIAASKSRYSIHHPNANPSTQSETVTQGQRQALLEEEALQPKPVRRRGRPPKQPRKDQQLTVTEGEKPEEEATQSKLVRSRGRPRKRLRKDQQDTPIERKKREEEATQSKPVRSRGRPRKHGQDTAVEEEKGEEEPPQTKPVWSRGRPRKQLRKDGQDTATEGEKVEEEPQPPQSKPVRTRGRPRKLVRKDQHDTAIEGERREEEPPQCKPFGFGLQSGPPNRPEPRKNEEHKVEQKLLQLQSNPLKRRGRPPKRPKMN